MNFFLFFIQNYSNFIEDDSRIVIRRSKTVRKRLFCDLSPNSSSEVQSSKRFKFHKSSSSLEECSSEDCSCDERSSNNNSLLFNIKETSSDEEEATIIPSKNLLLENHLMDTDDDKNSFSSIDYSVIDADYTIFREELSLKMADESFAVSTENEFSESEDLHDFEPSNISTEKICENFIQDFVDDVINDIICSIILEVEEPKHEDPQELLDEYITSIIYDIFDEIVENSTEQIIEKIIDEIIDELIKISDSENVVVKNIIEEIFGENTIEDVFDLQKTVYEEVSDVNLMDCSVAGELDVGEQMLVSEDGSQSR